MDDDDKTPSERSVGGNVTNYLLTGLAPLTEYSIRVAASTSVGMGPYSDSIMIKTDYRGGGTYIVCTCMYVCVLWNLSIVDTTSTGPRKIIEKRGVLREERCP